MACPIPAQVTQADTSMRARLKQLLITFIAVAIPVACLPLFIGWDLSRLLIIGLAVAFVIRTLILFLARTKVGLIVLVIASLVVIYVFGRRDPRAAGTAAAFAIIAATPSLARKV